jgi:GntR family transcriptional regulator
MVNMGIEVPLYFKIEQSLKKEIVSGKYKTGDLLPSEREMVLTYKVSRLTVRDAINRLVNQGLVEKLQGKGTYVAEGRADYLVGPLNSFEVDLLQKRPIIKTKVIKAEKKVASRTISKILNLEHLSSDKIFYLERLRYTNETPLAYFKTYLPISFVEGIEFIDFSKVTLYQALEEHFRLDLHEAFDVIDALLVNKKAAELLNLPIGAAVLRNYRKTFLKSGNIIEYEEVLYRSDKYKYRNKLIRRGGGAISGI